MSIDPTAAEGFSAGAAPYHRARPAYPDEAVRSVVEQLRPAPGSRVVELGAGTGKFTRSLRDRHLDVIAVEPVASMRERIATEAPGARVIAALAESLPLADGCAGLCVAAQAFHWFDGARALAEMRRVLAVGGGIALIWNARDTSVPWVAALARIVDEYGDAIRRHETEEWRDGFAGNTGFTPLERRTFPNPQEVDEAQVLDRVASTSFIATLAGEERDRVLERVRDLVRSHPDTRGRERFTFPHETRVYTATKV